MHSDGTSERGMSFHDLLAICERNSFWKAGSHLSAYFDCIASL